MLSAFEKEFEWCKRNAFSLDTLYPTERISSLNTKEIKGLVNIADPENDIDERSISTQIKKYDNDKFIQTPKLNIKTYFIISLFTWIEQHNNFSATTFSNTELCATESCTTFQAKRNQEVEQIFKVVIAGLDKEPDKCFAWGAYFLTRMLSAQPFSGNWSDVITLLWWKKLLQKYGKLEFRFPICLYLVDHIEELRSHAMKDSIWNLYLLLEHAWTSCDRKVNLPFYQHMDQSSRKWKEYCHDEKTLKRINTEWNKSNILRILSNSDLFSEGEVGMRPTCQFMQMVFVGLWLSYRPWAHELDSMIKEYENINRTDIPDLLALLSRGDQFYAEWSHEGMARKSCRK